MKLFPTIFLCVSLGLIAYPFWGVFDPESFRPELAEHYAYDASATSIEIAQASYWLLLPNVLLAFALVFLTCYLVNPTKRVFAYFSSALVVIVPFSKIYASAEMGFLLTSKSAKPIYAIEISTEGLVYILLGLIIVAMVKASRVAT